MKKARRALLGRSMKPVRIACINYAEETISGRTMSKLTAALQKCYDQHFLPVWGYPVDLYLTRKAKPTDWQLVYFDKQFGLAEKRRRFAKEDRRGHRSEFRDPQGEHHPGRRAAKRRG